MDFITNFQVYTSSKILVCVCARACLTFIRGTLPLSLANIRSWSCRLGGIDRHTKRDSLILSAVSAQPRHPATASCRATPGSCQIQHTRVCAGTGMCAGADGKMVMTRLKVKRRREVAISVNQARICMYKFTSID